MPRKTGYSFTFTFLLYPSEQEQGKHVAHCLELDVVAVATTRPKAILLLKELITELLVAAIEDDTLRLVFTPAPAKYWGMLANAQLYEPTAEVREHHIGALPVKDVNYAMATV